MVLHGFLVSRHIENLIDQWIGGICLEMSEMIYQTGRNLFPGHPLPLRELP
jgi:hypothetical protein